MKKWFDKQLSNVSFKNILYQDITPCDELIANVYMLDGEYLVESANELKFKVDNMVEVYDCINDISKTYKKYGKCWNLYNKFRKSMDNDEYEKYSIYISNYNDLEAKWIIDILKINI